MSEGHLFTPEASAKLRDQIPFAPNDPSDNRIRLLLSDEDSRKIGHGRGWRAVVTDLATQRTFEVKSAPCGLGCFCSARVVKELTLPPSANGEAT